MRDCQYVTTTYAMSEQEHHFGPNVHIIADHVLRSLLARLCLKQTVQPDINWLIRYLYQALVKIVINNEFPTKVAELTTRMADYHAEGAYDSEIIDPDTRVVLVDLARAGMLPSMVCFEYFNYLMNPTNVRLDHIYINRRVDSNNTVVGSNVSGHKIGGDVDNAIVIFPDPMGATGHSIKKAIDIILDSSGRRPQKLVALHLIITPEYVRYIHEHYPEVKVYGLRFDRGLSPAHVLETLPGTHKDLERGLDDRQYIVPGAGGLGEVINNSFV